MKDGIEPRGFIYCPFCIQKGEHPRVLGELKKGIAIITPSTEVIIDDEACFRIEFLCSKCKEISTLVVK